MNVYRKRLFRKTFFQEIKMYLCGMQKSTRDPQLKTRWENLIATLSERFSDGADMEVEGILYLIGLQASGKVHKRLKKDDNVNLIHIGICTVLEPYGYYRFDCYDEEGWPHFELIENLPHLKAGEQSLLMKQAIVEYFLKEGVIS